MKPLLLALIVLVPQIASAACVDGPIPVPVGPAGRVANGFYSFTDLYGGCAGSAEVKKLFDHWARTHPTETLQQFVADNRASLSPEWISRLDAPGGVKVRP